MLSGFGLGIETILPQALYAAQYWCSYCRFFGSRRSESITSFSYSLCKRFVTVCTTIPSARI